MAKSHTQPVKVSRLSAGSEALQAQMAELFDQEIEKHLEISFEGKTPGVTIHHRRVLRQGVVRAHHAVSHHPKVTSEDRQILELAKGVLIERLDNFRHRALLHFDPAVAALAGPIARLVAETRQKESEASIEALVKALLPRNDPLGSVTSRIEQDNAAARVRFFEAIPVLTNSALAELAGHRAGNKSATGTRWKAAARVFSVPHQGKEYYPAFQFADGQPLPVIARVLGALPKTMSAWQTAFWFVSSNPYLDGEEPYRRLTSQDELVAAAQAEADGFVG